MSKFENDKDFQKDLHTALQKPEFRDYVAKGLDGGKDSLFTKEKMDAMMKDPQVSGLIKPMMNLMANDPQFDFKSLDTLGGQMSEHMAIDADTSLSPEQKDAKTRQSKIAMSKTLSGMGINMGVGAGMDGQAMLQFLSDVFEKGPQMAIQNLLGTLKEGGASPEALAGVEKFAGFAGNFMHVFGKNYYEFGKHYFPQAKEAVSSMVKDGQAMAGGNISEAAQKRIDDATKPEPQKRADATDIGEGIKGEKKTAYFNDNSTGERLDGYKDVAQVAPVPAAQPGYQPQAFGLA